MTAPCGCDETVALRAQLESTKAALLQVIESKSAVVAELERVEAQAAAMREALGGVRDVFVGNGDSVLGTLHNLDFDACLIGNHYRQDGEHGFSVNEQVKKIRERRVDVHKRLVALLGVSTAALSPGAGSSLLSRLRAAEAGLLACAVAVGVTYSAEGHNVAPGPVDEVVKAIEHDRKRANDAIELATRAHLAEAGAAAMLLWLRDNARLDRRNARDGEFHEETLRIVQNHAIALENAYQKTAALAPTAAVALLNLVDEVRRYCDGDGDNMTALNDAVCAVDEAAVGEVIGAPRVYRDRDAALKVVRGLLKHVDPDAWPSDHACAECVPGGEIVKAGFQCTLHAGRALVADASRKQGGG